MILSFGLQHLIFNLFFLQAFIMSLEEGVFYRKFVKRVLMVSVPVLNFLVFRVNDFVRITLLWSGLADHVKFDGTDGPGLVVVNVLFFAVVGHFDVRVFVYLLNGGFKYVSLKDGPV